MVKVKPGVAFDVVAPAGYVILDALKKASNLLGKDLTITSGTDGVHSGPGDPHETGEAFDVRSHDFPPALQKLVLAVIMVQLDGRMKDRFYGSLEKQGQPDEHYHLQRRKGTTFGIEDLLNAG